MPNGLARRDFLRAAGVGAIAASVWPAIAQEGGEQAPQHKPHELPDLPYDYDALEPHYSDELLHLHHDLHHAGYVKGLNAAEEKLSAMLESGDFAEAKATCKALAFHGSGDVLHSMLWTNMKPGGGGEPNGALARALEQSFGSFERFGGLFMAAANSVEGSGWGILAAQPGGALVVLQAEKHENLTVWGVTPILVVDVWEHAYYPQYQNRRQEWTQTFVQQLVNWDDVARRLDAV